MRKDEWNQETEHLLIKFVAKHLLEFCIVVVVQGFSKQEKVNSINNKILWNINADKNPSLQVEMIKKDLSDACEAEHHVAVKAV